MFGRRWYGARFFAPRYFGPVIAIGPIAIQLPTVQWRFLADAALFPFAAIRGSKFLVIARELAIGVTRTVRRFVVFKTDRRFKSKGEPWREE